MSAYEPPVIVDDYTFKCYRQAVKNVTGVVQVEINPHNLDQANQFIRHRWPVFFTPKQQEVILMEYASLLMREKR